MTNLKTKNKKSTRLRTFWLMCCFLVSASTFGSSEILKWLKLVTRRESGYFHRNTTENGHLTSTSTFSWQSMVRKYSKFLLRRLSLKQVVKLNKILQKNHNRAKNTSYLHQLKSAILSEKFRSACQP
jgi:hypothetical protein